MTIETYAGPRVPALLARAQAELGSNAVVVDVQRSSLANGMKYFELTAADEATALALVSGPDPEPADVKRDPDYRTDERARSEVIAFVGPTGSGKTTTIAKLALNPRTFEGARVGLLSLDTYRPGGIEQLRDYARTGRIRLETAYRLKDIRRAKKKLRKCDVMLVDTPGRGPDKGRDVAAITEMLQELVPSEVHLVLPEGMSREHMTRLVAEYTLRGVTHLLATKLDEFPGERVVEDVAFEHGLPLRWMSTGQNVLGDLNIKSASPCREPTLETHELQLGAAAA